MVRHLTNAFLHSALSRGKVVQQLLSGEAGGGKWKIRWVELCAGEAGYDLFYHDDEKNIDGGFFDLSEWGEPNDPTTFSTIEEAIKYIVEVLGGSPDTFVNHGMIDDEAMDLLGLAR